MKVDREIIEHNFRYFFKVYSNNVHKKGWKLSIQGNTVDDVLYLSDKVSPYLDEIECSYKYGTKKLIDYTGDRIQQKHKLLTIYIPDNREVTEFAETIYNLMDGYTGGDDVPHPDGYKHYKGSIYYRCDRDENGDYIMPN